MSSVDCTEWAASRRAIARCPRRAACSVAVQPDESILSTFAPASTSSCATDRWPSTAAICSGVQAKFFSASSRSAFWSLLPFNRILAQSSRPVLAAMCRAVSPAWFCQLMSTPASTSILTMTLKSDFVAMASTALDCDIDFRIWALSSLTPCQFSPMSSACVVRT